MWRLETSLLTSAQKEENSLIEDARHGIERFFSETKARFEVLRKKFHFSAKH
jgi:hypothetical protein